MFLDPYYRTIEGFYVLVQKDWCAFGHLFEHRNNTSCTHREHSPIFLQFLDAVWQVLRQYPTRFEYTGHFLVTLAQAAYSGYFTTFRGDSDQVSTT